MITISPEVFEAITRQLQKRGTPNSSIRLGVRGGGCSGFNYVIEINDNTPSQRDVVFIFESIELVVDRKSLVYLSGTELHWQRSLMNSGFEFKNPNVKKSCGCNHSFEVNDVKAESRTPGIEVVLQNP